MMPTASLPMYNLSEMRSANALFWKALHGLLAESGLRDLPYTTSRSYSRATSGRSAAAHAR